MAQSGTKNGKPASQQAVDATLLTIAREELLENGSDLAFREMIHGLLAFTHQLDQIRDAFARIIDVNATQYEILLQLRRARPARLGVSDLASMLHRSLPLTTIDTGRLEERGLVGKQPDPSDGRRVTVGLTSKGLAVLRKVAPFQRETNDVLFASLRPADFSRLRRLLPLMNDDAERARNLLRFLAGGKNGD